MSSRAHFFDLNCLIKTNQRAWIVSKDNPNQPLYKLSQSEFKLIKSGIYKKKGNKIEFNGVNYFLPEEIWNRLKIISSKNNINFSNFVISLQEFLNKDLINDLEYELTLDPILNLQNVLDDIYIICSKQTKSLYDKFLSEIYETLKKKGIKITNHYYLNENFLNQNSDELYFKKIKLLLQHAVGYKSEYDKFTDNDITKYDMIYLYDKSLPLLNLTSSVKHIFDTMILSTDKGLVDVIKDDLRDTTPIIYINRIEDNKFNPIRVEKIELNTGRLIKKFEAFGNLKFYP